MVRAIVFSSYARQKCQQENEEKWFLIFLAICSELDFRIETISGTLFGMHCVLSATKIIVTNCLSRMLFLTKEDVIIRL